MINDNKAAETLAAEIRRGADRDRGDLDENSYRFMLAWAEAIEKGTKLD